MKITSIELRNVKIVDRMSEETTCFAADVYVDGKRVGNASNRGHGGNTDVHIADRQIRAAVEAYAAELLPAEYRGKTYVDAVEFLVDEMVERVQVAKEEKRIEKIDAKYRADFFAHGHTAYLRYTQGRAIRWLALRATPQNAGDVMQIVAEAAAKHAKDGPVESWVVRSAVTGAALFVSATAPAATASEAN